MPSIRLLPIDPVLVRLLDNDPERFESLFEVHLEEMADLARDVVQQGAALLRAYPRHPYFGAYLAADDETGQVVGTCAYKTGPNSDGEIEIAYNTFPPFEGRGYASAMTTVLVIMAEAVPAVRRVIAHTLPEANASSRVLEKNSFRNAGTVTDPEDGEVRRWEKYLDR
jgi:RimJ/RimL family protein N-acetyltransferase